MAKSLILHGGLPHVIWASDGFQFAARQPAPFAITSLEPIFRETDSTLFKPEWPQVNGEKCIDERPLRRKCQRVRANSRRLRRPDKSVLNVSGVDIDTNDDTARVYARCIRESSSRWIERCEHTIAQQK